MIIGAMNHPARDVIEEIAWIEALGLEFIDLTLEPPASASSRVNAKAIRQVLNAHGIGVVGHTRITFRSPAHSRKSAMPPSKN
jgi:hypothetical protein